MKMKKQFVTALIIGLVGSTALAVPPVGAVDKEVSKRHLIVYSEAGRFAGWPANNGAWIWGDEILVGFAQAYYEASDEEHSYDRNKPSKSVLARSLDGGETWSLEDPEGFVGDGKEGSPRRGRSTSPTPTSRCGLQPPSSSSPTIAGRAGRDPMPCRISAGRS